MGSQLLDRVRADAAAIGMNMVGLVDRVRFDASEPRERRIGNLAPACGTIVVLGSAGRAPARPLLDWNDGVGGGVRSLSVRGAEQIAALLRAAGVACCTVRFDGGCRVHPMRLGEAAGFGTVSPVSGLLLHPEYGPWLRVRAAVLCDGDPFGAVRDASISEHFKPCCGCDRPCLTACPASVHDGEGAHDLGACASHRHEGGCVDSCASRAACPLGAEHRDPRDVVLHGHTYELTSMQRWFGLGVWRFVPKSLRGGP